MSSSPLSGKRDQNYQPSTILWDGPNNTSFAQQGNYLIGAGYVQLVDNTGIPITSFGGGTQYSNGSVQASPTGTVALGYDGVNVRALKTDSSGALSVLGTVTANQGTANILANKWPVQITDGTNTMPTGDASARSIHTTLDNATIAVTESGTWTVQPGNTANTTAWLVTEQKSSAGAVGQAKIAVTGTAVQLASNSLNNGVIITAKSTNSAPITIGGSGVTNTVNGTGNGYILEAGASTSFAVTNTNALYINGTSGDIVSFAGS